MLLDYCRVNLPLSGAESGPGSFRSKGTSQTRHGETSYSSSLIPTEMASYRLRRWTRACTTFLDWRQGCVMCCVDVGTQATEQRCDASGPVQMQAGHHEGVSSCERDPHGDWMRAFVMRLSLSDILRSGERVVSILRDCVMRSGRKRTRRRIRDAERIPAAAGVLDFVHVFWRSPCGKRHACERGLYFSQVYLAQYFELFSLFDEIDTGSALPLPQSQQRLHL